MEFQMSDVTKITKVKRDRLKMWLENGWIATSVQRASGKGSRNIFSKDDLYRIVLFKKLVESGIDRKFAGLCTQGFFAQPFMESFLNPDIYCWFEIYRTGEGEYQSSLVLKPGSSPRDKVDCYDMVAINVSKHLAEIDLKIDQG